MDQSEINIKKILIIGGGTPLQKLLPYFFNNNQINIVSVFLNLKVDQSAFKFCKRNMIDCFAYNEIPERIEKLRVSNIDWLFNINSTIILSDEILELPKEGSLNLHPGLLPEYAGLHTHQWAIRNNEKKFGVTLHWMETGVDTGEIAFQKVFSLNGKETGLSLFLKCLKEGVELVKIALDFIAEEKEIPYINQDLSKRKLYTNKMAMDGTINWDMEYNDLQNFFRAANYKPFESPTYTPKSELNGQIIVVDSIKPDKTINKLPSGKIKIIDDYKILVGIKDTNVLIKPNLNKSNCVTMEDLIDFLKQSKKMFT